MAWLFYCMLKYMAREVKEHMSIEEAKDIINKIESSRKEHNCTDIEACKKKNISYFTYLEAKDIIKKYEDKLKQKEFEGVIEEFQKIAQNLEVKNSRTRKNNIKKENDKSL